MYSRIIKIPEQKSFFLFGPRGTGKTTWLKTHFQNDLYIDLLDAENFNKLLAQPTRLEQWIPPGYNQWIILDEVQRIPDLLNEVHRLIEKFQYKFILTGSSPRKLKRNNANLLAGRALTYHMHPLTSLELDGDFDLKHGLQYGHLPATFQEQNIKKYLESYVMTYLEQEILQEGLTRSAESFSRFLETASFSQGEVLNISEVAREASVHRKVAENYFSILEDLMIAYFVPVFSKRAKRKLVNHRKFYFFDVGIYRTLRPKGPLDSPEEIEGKSLETLLFQEIKALNDYLDLDYEISFWRTSLQDEIDFVLYGPRGLKAIEIKRTEHISYDDFRGMKLFLKDYPEAKGYILYGGKKHFWEKNIEIIPIVKFLKEIQTYL